MQQENFLDLAALKIFLETAKDSNMTRAAEALGVSQPAVSAAIKKIESALGVQVFDRECRPIQLTTAGRHLMNRAFGILEQLEALTHSIQSAVAGNKLDLRLAASDTMSACVCPPLMSELLEVTENLSARSGTTPAVSRMLTQKNVDIALSSDPMEDVHGTRSFHFITERFLFILPKEATKGREVRSNNELLEAVKGLNYLRFGKETFDFVQSERIYRSLHIMDTRRVEVDTNTGMFDLIARGKGWAILPPLSLWAAHSRLDDLDYFTLTQEATRRYFVICNDQAFEETAKLVYKYVCRIFEYQIFPQMRRCAPKLLSYLELKQDPGAC